MALIKYENRDQVPVFVHVLDMCAYFYSQIALKIAVLNHYQELKYTTIAQHLNETMLIMVAATVSDINRTLERTAEHYALNLEDFLNSDKRIAQLAEDLYWALIADAFPESITEEDCDTLDYLPMLESHALSLLNIADSLFEMFCTGELDLENLDHLEKEHDDFFLSRNCHWNNLTALGELVMLNNRLRGHYNELYKYYLTFKPERNEDNYL